MVDQLTADRSGACDLCGGRRTVPARGYARLRRLAKPRSDAGPMMPCPVCEAAREMAERLASELSCLAGELLDTLCDSSQTGLLHAVAERVLEVARSWASLEGSYGGCGPRLVDPIRAQPYGLAGAEGGTPRPTDADRLARALENATRAFQEIAAALGQGIGSPSPSAPDSGDSGQPGGHAKAGGPRPGWRYPGD